MTYAEYNGKAPFNWVAFLNKKKYTEAELDEADRLASGWVTCACGNLCAALPRSSGGVPADRDLQVLGDVFSTKISRLKEAFHCGGVLQWPQRAALEVLAKIESRSEELLNSPTT